MSVRYQWCLTPLVNERSLLPWLVTPIRGTIQPPLPFAILLLFLVSSVELIPTLVQRTFVIMVHRDGHHSIDHHEGGGHRSGGAGPSILEDGTMISHAGTPVICGCSTSHQRCRSILSGQCSWWSSLSCWTRHKGSATSLLVLLVFAESPKRAHPSKRHNAAFHFGLQYYEHMGSIGGGSWSVLQFLCWHRLYLFKMVI
jgi:hypothetical protein